MQYTQAQRITSLEFDRVSTTECEFHSTNILVKVDIRLRGVLSMFLYMNVFVKREFINNVTYLYGI